MLSHVEVRAVIDVRASGKTAASLTAEVAIAVFKLAFERWVVETNKRACRNSSESHSGTEKLGRDNDGDVKPVHQLV